MKRKQANITQFTIKKQKLDEKTYMNKINVDKDEIAEEETKETEEKTEEQGKDDGKETREISEDEKRNQKEKIFETNSTYKFVLGDCLEKVKDIPNESIKLIVTSPPYNIGKEYEKKKDLDSYINTQKVLIKELYRVLQTDGSICWQVGNFVEDGEIFPLDIYYYSIFKELGMKLRNRIIWTFGHGL